MMEGGISGGSSTQEDRTSSILSASQQPVRTDNSIFSCGAISSSTTNDDRLTAVLATEAHPTSGLAPPVAVQIDEEPILTSKADVSSLTTNHVIVLEDVSSATTTLGDERVTTSSCITQPAGSTSYKAAATTEPLDDDVVNTSMVSQYSETFENDNKEPPPPPRRRCCRRQALLALLSDLLFCTASSLYVWLSVVEWHYVMVETRPLPDWMMEITDDALWYNVTAPYYDNYRRQLQDDDDFVNATDDFVVNATADDDELLVVNETVQETSGGNIFQVSVDINKADTGSDNATATAANKTASNGGTWNKNNNGGNSWSNKNTTNNWSNGNKNNWSGNNNNNSDTKTSETKEKTWNNNNVWNTKNKQAEEDEDDGELFLNETDDASGDFYNASADDVDDSLLNLTDDEEDGLFNTTLSNATDEDFEALLTGLIYTDDYIAVIPNTQFWLSKYMMIYLGAALGFVLVGVLDAARFGCSLLSVVMITAALFGVASALMVETNERISAILNMVSVHLFLVEAIGLLVRHLLYRTNATRLLKCWLRLADGTWIIGAGADVILSYLYRRTAAVQYANVAAASLWLVCSILYLGSTIYVIHIQNQQPSDEVKGKSTSTDEEDEPQNVMTDLEDLDQKHHGNNHDETTQQEDDLTLSSMSTNTGFRHMLDKLHAMKQVRKQQQAQRPAAPTLDESTDDASSFWSGLRRQQQKMGLWIPPQQPKPQPPATLCGGDPAPSCQNPIA